MCVVHVYMSADACRDQSHQITLELEFQVVMSYSMWVLGTKL